jgi:hypothetical protein
VGLVLAWQCPGFRALATQKKLTYLGFHYSLDLARLDYHLLPELKKQLKGGHFSSDMLGHCCHGDLVGQTTFWIFFFE